MSVHSRSSRIVCSALVLIALVAGMALAAPNKRSPSKPGIRLILPKVIYGVPGIEMNVYFDNVCLVVNPANYVFDVTCSRGMQQVERWTFAPTDKDVGDRAFKLDVRDGANRIIATASSVVRVVPAKAGAGKAISLLCVGDSLTANSVYAGHIAKVCVGPTDPKLTLIGSRGRGRAKHEGYGGWTAHRFATHFTGKQHKGNYRELGSPFLYKVGAAKPKFDFARYCKEFNGGKAPDYVTILLGCNDTFSSSDETIKDRIDTMFKHYEMLLKMIHSVSKDTRIGCLLLVPPAGTQDAFGQNYKSNQTRWQYKRNQHRVVERMMKQFGGRERKNVFILPSYVNLDCARNYPKYTKPANSRTTERITRLGNGVHPSAQGYFQIGDTIYSWVKAMEAVRAK